MTALASVVGNKSYGRVQHLRLTRMRASNQTLTCALPPPKNSAAAGELRVLLNRLNDLAPVWSAGAFSGRASYCQDFALTDCVAVDLELLADAIESWVFRRAPWSGAVRMLFPL